MRAIQAELEHWENNGAHFGSGFSTTNFISPDFERQMEHPRLDAPTFKRMRACTIGLMKTKRELGHGYTLQFEPEYYRNRYMQWAGLFLVLRNPDYKRVGLIQFRLGYPLEIRTIQGERGQEPKIFYEKTGRHFDELLIDELVHAVHTHFPKPGTPAKPKIVFDHSALIQLSRPNKNRIAARYLPPSLTRSTRQNANQTAFVRLKENRFRKLGREKAARRPNGKK